MKERAGAKEIKIAYRTLVRKYHPDLNPPGDVAKNNAIMIRLNLAYHSLIQEAKSLQKLAAANAANAAHETRQKPESAPNPGPQHKSAPAASQEEPLMPALPKDPAYTYYKTAHRYFHRGFYKFYRKKAKLPGKLAAAMEIVASFQKAYTYYRKVVDEYPNSVWRHDAAAKIKKIEQLTPIYSLISTRLKKLNDEEEIKFKTWEELEKKRGIYSYKDIEKLALNIWEVNKL